MIDTGKTIELKGPLSLLNEISSLEGEGKCPQKICVSPEFEKRLRYFLTRKENAKGAITSLHTYPVVIDKDDEEDNDFGVYEIIL